jgi:NADH-quinone oxidoreductase subunit A
VTPAVTAWFPIAVMLLGAALVIGTMVTINRLVGPRNVGNKVKGESFECGNPSSGSAWGRFSVRFYLTAILFLLFDVEVVFLIPWAADLRELGVFGFVEALVFIAILLAGLVYAWQRGALDWN